MNFSTSWGVYCKPRAFNCSPSSCPNIRLASGSTFSLEKKIEGPLNRSLKPCSWPSYSHVSRNESGTESWWIERKRSADSRLARATRANRLFLAGPSVTSKTVLAKPAASNFCLTSVASRRLKSYSQKPRALGAPGDSAVCPTSTTTRKAAWSQAERGNFFAGPPGPSAHAQCHAPCPSSNARATTGAIRRRKVIPNSPFPSPPKQEEQTELVLAAEASAPNAPLVGLRQAQNLLCDEI